MRRSVAWNTQTNLLRGNDGQDHDDDYHADDDGNDDAGDNDDDDGDDKPIRGVRIVRNSFAKLLTFVTSVGMSPPMPVRQSKKSTDVFIVIIIHH